MNKVAAYHCALALAASLYAVPLHAQDVGSGIAGDSCGPGSELIWVNAFTGAARGNAPGKVGGARKDTGSSQPRGIRVSLAGAPQAGGGGQGAQWLRHSDSPVAKPGTWVVLVAGFLGIWAVARRRNLSS